MKKILYGFVVFLSLFLGIYTILFVFDDSSNNILSAFTTDGCSYFPNGTPFKGNAWLECCVEHDKSYWKGGSSEEKDLVDFKLGECVSGKGYPLIGFLMKYGVKIGGSAYLPTSFRWGYGWSHFKGYSILRTSDIGQVSQFMIKH